MLASLLALVWLASLGSLAHAGAVTTTTTEPTSSTTSTTLDPITTTTTLATTTSTTEATSTTILPSTTSTTEATSTTILPTTTSTTETTSTTTPASTTTSSSSSTSLPPSSTTVTSSTQTTTTSSSTSTSSSTTSSTLPGVEQCGNCLDDDGDGLTDFEDPDCCLGAPGVLSVERLDLKSIGAVTRVDLAASGLPAVTTLSPSTQTLYVQLAPDDGTPMLCASVHAVHWKAKRDRATFADRTNGVPSARGLTAITLQRLRTGALRATFRGARAHFYTPPAQRVRVAIGLQSLVTPGAPVRCAVQTVDVTTGPDGTLETP